MNIEFTPGNPPKFAEIEVGMRFGDKRDDEILTITGGPDDDGDYPVKSSRGVSGSEYLYSASWKEGNWTFLGYAEPKREDNYFTKKQIEACREPWTPKVGDRVMVRRDEQAWRPDTVSGIPQPGQITAKKNGLDYGFKGESRWDFREPAASELMQHWPDEVEGVTVHHLARELDVLQNVVLKTAWGFGVYSLVGGNAIVYPELEKRIRDKLSCLEAGDDCRINVTTEIASSSPDRFVESVKSAVERIAKAFSGKPKTCEYCDRPAMPVGVHGLCSVCRDETLLEDGDMKQANDEFAKKQADNKRAWSRQLHDDAHHGRMLSGMRSMVGRRWDGRG